MRTLFHRFLPEKTNWSFQKVDLQESTRQLHNPSRGWYRIYTFEVDKTPDFQPMLWCDLEMDTLVMVILNIGAYKEKALDSTALENIQCILQYFVKRQYEIILRITYDHEGKALEREPFFFSTVKEHLQQLIPIMNAFKDNIFVYQGLLIGSWGEMHTSRFLHPFKLKELWGILKAQASEEIFFAVRKPAYWRMLHPDRAGDNMGLFDDAIFGSENHLGTFGVLPKEGAAWDALWSKADELGFEEELCKSVPNGGEALCGEQYLQCENAISTVKTLQRMHITYLNKEYDERLLGIWKEWKWEGVGAWKGRTLYDYIGNHLGYRFWVKDVELATIRASKEEGIITITVENLGFANCYEESEVIIEQIDNEGNSREWILDTDVRRWDSGMVHKITTKIPLVAGELYLSVRRKRDKVRILLANQGTKEEKILLGHIIKEKDGVC